MASYDDYQAALRQIEYLMEVNESLQTQLSAALSAIEVMETQDES